jgi:hypothetical protein
VKMTPLVFSCGHQYFHSTTGAVLDVSLTAALAWTILKRWLGLCAEPTKRRCASIGPYAVSAASSEDTGLRLPFLERLGVLVLPSFATATGKV